jgi:replicative DNA helicase
MPPVSGSAYDKSFQQQLLAHLRWEADLLRMAVRILNVDDFEIPVMRVVYEALQRYYLRYRKIPLENELDDELVAVIHNLDGNAKSGINPEEYEALTSVRLYMATMADARYRNLERFQSELGSYISWVRSTKILGALSPALYRGASKPEVLAGKLNDITLEVASKLDSEESQKFYSQNTGIMMDDSEADFKVSTGVSGLDAKMDGGLGLGELGMITACPGLGKTTTLINFAAGANFVGQHSLLLTLELPEKLIKRRYTAIAGCISGTVVKSVFTKWSEENKKRLQALQHQDFAAHDYFSVSDRAGKAVTVDMIAAEIDTWRERVRRRWGDYEANNCTSVHVDWADLLHLRQEGKDEAEHLRVRNILRELKALAVNKNVAMWTATQGTKEADGKQVLHMRHVSYGYHKNDAIDIGVGLGLAMTDQQAQQYQQQMEAEGRAPDISENGRTMLFNFNKNRNASIGVVRVYQAPTLRFYNKIEDYRHHNDMLTRATNVGAVWAAAPRKN